MKACQMYVLSGAAHRALQRGETVTCPLEGQHHMSCEQTATLSIAAGLLALDGTCLMRVQTCTLGILEKAATES